MTRFRAAEPRYLGGATTTATVPPGKAQGNTRLELPSSEVGTPFGAKAGRNAVAAAAWSTQVHAH